MVASTSARRSLVIVGDSSFAEVASELFEAEGRYEVAAFAVHRVFRKRETLLAARCMRWRRSPNTARRRPTTPSSH